MAKHNEREGSQELQFSVAPIAGPASRRQTNVREDNAAGSGFQSPTFNIDSPRSKKQVDRLRTRKQHREAAAPSNPLAGRSRPAEDPPQSARSLSKHKTIEQTPADPVLLQPETADSAAESELGSQDDPPVNDDASEEDDTAFGHMQFDPERMTSSMAAKRSELAAESNKENEPQLAPEIRRKQKTRLIDAQDGARAVSFDSQEQVANSHAEVPDPTQDQGFQPSRNNARVQSGGVGNSRNRQGTANAQDRGPSPPKRQRTRGPQRENRGRAASNTSPLRERQPPAQADVYGTINATAKARNANVPRPTQVRTPWSTRETNKLLELIQDFGPKWARLKTEDEDDVLRQRDQIALKDKARNMKLDYLKAGRGLPMNFEAIAISNLQIEKLHQLGIEYDKMTGHRVDGIFNDEEDNE